MNTFVQVAQIAAGVAAIVALLFTSTTFIRSRKANGVSFLMSLNDKLNQEKYYLQYVKIREGSTALDWPVVDELLGLYEIASYALRDLSINRRIFGALHLVRLENIFASNLVFDHKLVNEYRYWAPIFELLEAISPKSRKTLKTMRKQIMVLKGVLIHAGTVAKEKSAIYESRDRLIESFK